MTLNALKEVYIGSLFVYMQVKELEDIFEDETEIPQVISLPEYLLSKSGGEKLSCTLHVDFNYKEGKMVMEEIQFEEDFTEAAKGWSKFLNNEFTVV